jgi:dihydrofolate reductase
MRKLTVFNFVSLDGYYEGPKKGDISWHKFDPEEAEYSTEMLSSGNILLFGRVTYDLMATYWPTPSVIENDPFIAKLMNESEKIVFSKSLKKAGWNNTEIIRKKIVKTVHEMKQQPGKDMTILGSGNIIKQFAEKGLIDEYQLMLVPVIIGKGSSMFKDIKIRLNLNLIKTITFKSGNILLFFEQIQPAFVT